MRINKTIVREIKQAKKRLEALCDVDNDSECAIDPEHKEAVRLYVQSWVTPLLSRALERIEGTRGSRSDWDKADR